ncbi:hypothetical protein AAZX31_18G124000 [Glycine max]
MHRYDWMMMEHVFVTDLIGVMNERQVRMSVAMALYGRA